MNQLHARHKHNKVMFIAGNLCNNHSFQEDSLVYDQTLRVRFQELQK